jgi:hypothetical protein
LSNTGYNDRQLVEFSSCSNFSLIMSITYIVMRTIFLLNLIFHTICRF